MAAGRNYLAEERSTGRSSSENVGSEETFIDSCDMAPPWGAIWVTSRGVRWLWRDCPLFERMTNYCAPRLRLSNKRCGTLNQNFFFSGYYFFSTTASSGLSTGASRCGLKPPVERS